MASGTISLEPYFPPDPNGVLLPNNILQFDVIATFADLDLVRTVITINEEVVFTNNAFTPNYSTSTITHVSGLYKRFNVTRIPNYPIPLIRIKMEGLDINDNSGSGTYNVFANTVSINPIPPYPLDDYTPGQRVSLGEVQLDSLSGELNSGPLANTLGAVFMSPAFNQIKSGNIIDIDGISLTTNVTDVYPTVSQENGRPFILGLTPGVSARVYPPNFSPINFEPRLNGAFRLLPNKRNDVTGTLINTMTLDTTRILY